MNYIVNIYGDPVEIIANLRTIGIPFVQTKVVSFKTGSINHSGTGYSVIAECTEEQFKQIKKNEEMNVRQCKAF